MDHKDGRMMHHMDFLNWPVIGLNVAVIAWFHDLMALFPTATTIYTAVTIMFMLFQMADKLGWLESLKSEKDADDASQVRKKP